MTWIEAASFDLAVMALVIHHLDNRTAVLRELHRILAPEGALVVSTHHPTKDWLRQGGSYFDVSVIEETWSRGWNIRYWRLPLTQTVAEFTDAGFSHRAPRRAATHPQMADQYPEEYRQLQSEPGFIAFRLTKRGNSRPTTS